MSNKQTIKIDFYNEIDEFEIVPSLKAYIKRAFNEAKKEYAKEYSTQVSVSFVDEDAIRRYNKENRNTDSVTDVLSFPLLDCKEGIINDTEITSGEFDEDGYLMLGDVVICVNVAKKQALEYGHGEDREIVYLFVHSVMHLFGFDHMEDGEKRNMRAAEEKIMNRIGLTRDE